jgi:hypothetical protein
MPPIQQQQTSRAGLITALVISIICALGFLVWAIMESSAKTKLEQANAVMTSRYKEVIDEGRLGDVAGLRTAFGGQSPSVKVIEAAENQRRKYAGMITGSSDDNDKTVADSFTALKDRVAKSGALKGTSIPSTSLSAMVEALVTKAEADSQAMAAATKARDDAIKAKEAAVTQYVQLAETHKAAADTAVTASAKFGTDATTAIADKQKQVEEFSRQVTELQTAMSNLQQQLQLENQTIQRKADDTQKKLDQALVKLGQTRMDVKNPLIRAADAKITQVAQDSICYIDLGFGSHVMPGLTFEVYDRLEGIPPLGEGTSNLDMPKGKASVEIINVGQNSSQCRIIRTTQGQTVGQGDICANLVFDRNIRPIFYVYGKFDTDQNNVATDPETENIKNLIQRWGGQLSDKLNVDVDYVIMGKEPTLPNYTKEDLESSPIAKQRYDEAVAQQKAYEDVRGQASTMHIPVMNQNRFVYYTGYFEVAKR